MAARTETPGNHYLPLNQQHRHIPGAPPQSYALYPVVKHRRKASLTPSSPSSSPRLQQPPSYSSLNNTNTGPNSQLSSFPQTTQHHGEKTHLYGREGEQKYTQPTATKGKHHNKSSSSGSGSSSSTTHRDHTSQSTNEKHTPQQSSSRSEKTPQTKFSPGSSANLSGSRAPNKAIIADRVKDSKSVGNTRLDEQQQQRQQQPHFGGGVPRQPGSSTKAYGKSQGEGENIRLQGQAPLASTHNRGYGVPQQQQHQQPQQQPATLSTLNTGVPRQGSQGSASTTPTSPSGSVKPELVTAIPTSSLCLSFDEDYEGDQVQDLEKHQKQALQFQRKLQQKPPKKRGDWDSDDDDSDSGSMVSYRRSIQRLSVSYNTKGRAGIPNISLFGPNQRPNPLVKHDRSGSGASGYLAEAQLLVKEQREDRMRQQREKDRLQEQQQRQQQQTGTKTSPNHGHNKSGTYGSSSSLASIDQHSRQEDGRPRIVRANTANSPPTQRIRNVQVPERSTSADNIYHPNRSPRQGSQGSLQYHRDQQQRNGGQPGSPSLSSMQVIRGQHEPRPSHESSQSQRSNYSRGGKQEYMGVSTKDFRQETAGYDPTSSRSPSRGGALSPVGGGQFFRKGSSASTRGPGGYGPGPAPPGMLNMHPAHHHPSNGYVRPEEAVGPSNPMPEKAEDYVRKGIEFHELGEISKATHYFRRAAEIGDPVGMLMYGLSVRHGWGCTANRVLAFQYLQKSAEHAVGDLNSRDSFASTAAKGELVLAIYELGICFRHGWGVDKDKKTAAYYFEIAADLGDPDAQNDLAWCYYHGIGVKKDMFKSAKYYRLAAAQGQELIGNSWIWKDKYGGPTSPTVVEKAHAHSSSIRA